MTKPATTALEALQRTRKILDDPERWIKGEWASTLDEQGLKVGSRKICYCTDGALIAAVEGATHREAYSAMNVSGRDTVLREFRSIHTQAESFIVNAADELYPYSYEGVAGLVDEGWSGVVDFNDALGRAYEEIIAVLDHAIALAAA